MLLHLLQMLDVGTVLHMTQPVVHFVTTNASGCDSTATLNLTINNDGTVLHIWLDTATLNLTINNATSSTTDVTACDSYDWNGTTYTASGSYTFTTTNASGCDSTATLNLTINNATSSTTDVTDVLERYYLYC